MSFYNALGMWLRNFRPPAFTLSLLPGTSRDFGPPRSMQPAASALSKISFLSETPAITFAPPTLLNQPDPYWLNPHSVLPPNRPFIFETENARLLYPGCWVVVNPDTFITDTSFWGHKSLDEARKWHSIFKRKRALRTKRLSGRTLSLASDFAPWSYGHWLIDSLPRWLIARSFGLSGLDYDYIYLPSPDTPTTRHLIAELGLDSRKIISAPPTCDLEIEDLTAVSFPGTPGAACSLARRQALELSPHSRPRRRLFLSRNGFRRNFSDPDGVLRVLQKRGFELCNPAVDPQVLGKCGEAEILLGIEGSQMFNALFAPPGGKMIVVAPDGFHPLPYMQTIAGASCLNLFIIGARTEGSDFRCKLSGDTLARLIDGIVIS